jgi:hypothetical protein
MEDFKKQKNLKRFETAESFLVQNNHEPKQKQTGRPK